MNRQTREEFEAEAARLKTAVRNEYRKQQTELYPALTIRQTMEIWAKAKGVAGEREACRFLEQMACQYDIDSVEEFDRWLPNSGHALDLAYSMILFRPERALLTDGTEGWIFCMKGDNALLLATYAERLQNSDVLFCLFDPQKVMKKLGYWTRDRRRDYKKAMHNNLHKI